MQPVPHGGASSFSPYAIRADRPRLSRISESPGQGAGRPFAAAAPPWPRPAARVTPLPLLPSDAPGLPVKLLPGVRYLAQVMASGGGGWTVATLVGATGQGDRWVRSHLAAGKGAGLLTEAKEPHNRSRWTAVQFSENGKLSPPKNRKNISPSGREKKFLGGGGPPTPKAKKLPRVPECVDPQRVLRLAETWRRAFRVAAGDGIYRRSLFATARPWESADPKVLRRWADAVRLEARLTEAGVDPAEFCAAVAAHFAWRSAQAGRPVRTSMRQVSGDYGQQIWTRWRERRLAEGGVSAAQQESRVTAAAAIGTETEGAEIARWMRQAWKECAQEGAEWAVTCVWPAEVLWLLAITEPAARYAVTATLQTSAEGGPIRLAEIAKIRENDARKGWLLKLRRETLGTTRPLLPMEGGHA